MSIPEPFNSISSYEDALEKVTEYVSLNNKLTNVPSQINTFPASYAHYLADAHRAKGVKEKSAIAAKMVTTTLRLAAPVASQVYLMSKKAQIVIKNYFNDTTTELEYDTFLGKDAELNDVNMANKYVNEVIAFRTFLKERLGNIPGADILTNEPKAVITVGDNATTIVEMLDHMNRVWSDRNGGAKRGTENIAEKEEFMDKAYKALMVDYRFDIINPYSKLVRASTGFGTHITITEDKVIEEEADHCLLLSSALAMMKTRNSIRYNSAIEKMQSYVSSVEKDADNINYQNLALIIRILSEVKKILLGEEQQNQQVGFTNQQMNIDPIFLTFYFVYKVLNLEVKEFYVLQRYIYSACLDIRGQSQMKNVFSKYSETYGNMKRVMAKISASSKIYLPPWVMKYSRIYDMSAVIGACDCAAFATTIKTPAISWRYMLCMKSTKKGYFNFLANLWEIEKEQQESTELGIYSSERALHQAILGRQGPLNNTNLISGNALDVEISADEPPDDNSGSIISSSKHLQKIEEQKKSLGGKSGLNTTVDVDKLKKYVMEQKNEFAGQNDDEIKKQESQKQKKALDTKEGVKLGSGFFKGLAEFAKSKLIIDHSDEINDDTEEISNDDKRSQVQGTGTLPKSTMSLPPRKNTTQNKQSSRREGGGPLIETGLEANREYLVEKIGADQFEVLNDLNDDIFERAKEALESKTYSGAQIDVKSTLAAISSYFNNPSTETFDEIMAHYGNRINLITSARSLIADLMNFGGTNLDDIKFEYN